MSTVGAPRDPALEDPDLEGAPADLTLAPAHAIARRPRVVGREHVAGADGLVLAIVIGGRHRQTGRGLCRRAG